MMAAVQPLLEQVGALNIGSSKRSQRLSFSLSEKMLGFHIGKKKKIKEIAKALNSSFYHHGYAVGRQEAIAIGLPVAQPNPDIEDLLWRIWLDYEAEMKCNENFNIVKEIMSDPNAATAINSVPVIPMPVNLPDVQKQAIYNRIAATVNATQQQSLNIKCMLASIESPALAKAVYNEMTIAYWRDVKLNLQFSLTQKVEGWADY
jgi:hypothetical protein